MHHRPGAKIESVTAVRQPVGLVHRKPKVQQIFSCVFCGRKYFPGWKFVIMSAVARLEKLPSVRSYRLRLRHSLSHVTWMTEGAPNLSHYPHNNSPHPAHNKPDWNLAPISPELLSDWEIGDWHTWSSVTWMQSLLNNKVRMVEIIICPQDVVWFNLSFDSWHKTQCIYNATTQWEHFIALSEIPVKTLLLTVTMKTRYRALDINIYLGMISPGSQRLTFILKGDNNANNIGVSWPWGPSSHPQIVRSKISHISSINFPGSLFIILQHVM